MTARESNEAFLRSFIGNMSREEIENEDRNHYDRELAERAAFQEKAKRSPDWFPVQDFKSLPFCPHCRDEYNQPYIPLVKIKHGYVKFINCYKCGRFMDRTLSDS